jgi:subtilase family serine protease
VALLSAIFSIPVLPLFAQEIARPLISQPLDESKLTVLRGNTHPLARAEFDRGAAPADLPMNHMQLLLRRSPEQEAALERLMAEQLDRLSPNYHKWLTPEQFGEQFGPSDQDILTITGWLQSHGFLIGNAPKGKTTIDFSGTAAQVQQAFHTPIHKYVINGQEHWANVKDPAIPSALTASVEGIVSLHNFFPRAQSVAGPARQINRPLYTFPTNPQCSESTSSSNTNPCLYGVGPADFDKIYNVPSSLTGAGETIAIVSDSDINSTDVDQFRQIFGLPAKNFQQIETDPSGDPGIQPPNRTNSNGDEVEAILDVEWAGAVAPAAMIDLVVSPTTNTTSGIDTSAQYIVNNKLAPIMGVSYGLCELDLGTAGNSFHNMLWQQAAAEGITVLVSAGDNGAAGCDIVEVNGASTQPATEGLEVSGLASTPYNLAVGGTDFNDPTPSTYWGTSNNSTTQLSALSYIPETTWNETCTNTIVVQFFNDANVAAACNDPVVQQFENSSGVFLVAPTGGSGGVSNCTTNSTTSTTLGPPSSCSGGYAKPTWQTGPGVPNDGKRDLPDLSMFSGDGLISGSFYIACEADLNGTSGSVPCNLSSQDFVAVGGTSAATQAMAGIVALIDQKEGSAQGNVNPVLYSLASQQSPSSCNSSSPGASCVFNNVTVGTIAMPCGKGSPNCTVTGSNQVGVLSGYNAGTGYNLATGLGSLNVANLTNLWGPTFYLSSANPAVTISSPGASGTLTVMVNAVNGFTGSVALACSGLPSGDTCSFSPSSPVSLTNSTTSVSVTVTVQTVKAHTLPTQRPWGRRPLVIAVSSIIAALLAYICLVIALATQKRWVRTAFAVAAFSAVIAIAGCAGSGNSGGGGGGGGTGTSTATVMGTSGRVASSMTFALTVQ